MWIKIYKSGHQLIEGEGITWYSTPLNDLQKVGIWAPWQDQWLFLPAIDKYQLHKLEYYHFYRAKSYSGNTRDGHIKSEHIVIRDQDNNFIHGIELDYHERKVKVW